MKRWMCEGCGYVYDPVKGDASGGIPPGTPWEHLASDWVCPICGLGKDCFSEYDADRMGEEF